ncbi:GntR family transcriptional regulator [Methylobacterium sp. BTF04]|uniref:GntR family transcriptional regulator n=1 Tax=Methylobacterium sp. BTF04 TaxID=2708300 RepID=UPI0013D3F7B7|nr:GntR family transcriptional regulator [Methylobacterium sp. BTF04]NEU13179.1 GntR family transcriptional regulator [Methylobacterium sp. BTF04]
MTQSRRLRQTIETEIVDGRLAIGARLDETEMAERFGVSRTPIREALLQLAMTGLVEIKPRRGAIVSAPDPQLLIAMFETMAEIEASCGRLAARRLVPEDEASLKDALAACAVAAAAEDPERYYQENYLFHTVIYRACRNVFLSEQARQLHRRLAPFRRMQLRARNRLGQSLAEHEAIVAAIIAGDEAAASDRLRAHVIVQGDRFCDLVASLRSINTAA